ncbi:hypothetical protein NXH58_03065 [Agathobacter ruminis]|nr:hypothetical protein [Agathobacter ruminis]
MPAHPVELELPERQALVELPVQPDHQRYHRHRLQESESDLPDQLLLLLLQTQMLKYLLIHYLMCLLIQMH